MNRRSTYVLVVVLVLSMLPSFTTSAATSINFPIQRRLAQTSPSQCTNKDFLTGLGKDLNDFAAKVKATDMTSGAAVTQLLLSTSDLRKKYEDMDDVTGCEDAQATAFIAFANGGDLIALALATQADSKNAATYAQSISAQSTRFGQAIDEVLVDVGVATPSATAPTAQAAISCKDASFVTGLGQDFTDLGTQVKGTDMTDPAAIAKTLLSVSAVRRKYEDLNFQTDDCLYAQFDIIAAFANASDLLALPLAIKVDPANADTYSKAVTTQAARFQKSIQDTLVDLGLATPQPDATTAQ